MVQLALKQHEDGDYPERVPFKDMTVFEAVVLEVAEQDSRFPANDDEPDGPRKKQLSFKFKVVDPDGEYDERWIWGNTSSYFSTAPQNKLRQWVQSILDEDILPEGYLIDTDEFVGRQVRIIVGAKPRKSGDGISNFVTELRPTKSQKPLKTVNAVDEDLEPF